MFVILEILEVYSACVYKVGYNKTNYDCYDLTITTIQ